MNTPPLINCNASFTPLASQSIHCVITSPPYYKHRDYSVSGQLGREKIVDCGAWMLSEKTIPCGKCFICNLITVFREVWRILRDDGSLWVNMGDNYDKNKNLVGVPWKLAFALQKDGWILRNDVIWWKLNGIPESVKDRLTKAHEYFFFFTKSKQYYFDSFAIKEPLSPNTLPRAMRALFATNKNVNGAPGQAPHGIAQPRARGEGLKLIDPNGRNKRTVWSVATTNYKGAHFAVYPPKLIEPCILAGTSEKGVCNNCGKPYIRIILKKGQYQRRWSKNNAENSPYSKQSSMKNIYGFDGWKQNCKCKSSQPIRAKVYDPFCGSGTTVFVAEQFGRIGIGNDINFDFLKDEASPRIEKERKKALKKKRTKPEPRKFGKQLSFIQLDGQNQTTEDGKHGKTKT